MLDTISEEDINRLRRVLRILFVVSGLGTMGLAIFSSVKAWETRSSDWCVGFALLACVLWTSCAFSFVFARSCVRESALEMFQQPCVLRWISYAITFPMQLIVCAWYTDLRDLHIVLMIVTAEAVCALLGFVMEQAWMSKDLEEPVLQRSDPMSLGVGTVVRGPQVDPAQLLTQRQKAGVAWTVCLACVLAMHAAVWFVVVDNENKTGGSDAMEKNLRLGVMTHTHCGLMSLVWLVPLLQVLLWWLGATSVEEGLVAGSMAYSALDTAAKVQLAVAYMVSI